MAVAINVKLSKRGDFEGRPLFLSENNEPITTVTDNADLIKIPFRMAGSQLFDIMNDDILAPTKSMPEIIRINGEKSKFFESVSVVNLKEDINLRVRFLNDQKKIAKGDFVDDNGWVYWNVIEVPFKTLGFDRTGDFWVNSPTIFMEVMYDSYKLGELCCCDPTYIDSLMECDPNVNCSQYECFVKPSPTPTTPTPEEDKGLETWMIILMVVIAVILLAIITGAILYYNSSKTSDLEYNGDNQSINNGDSNSGAGL